MCHWHGVAQPPCRNKAPSLSVRQESLTVDLCPQFCLQPLFPHRWRFWFIFPINVNADRIKVSKLQFARAIQAEGIGLNPHYNYLVSDWSWAHQYLSDTFDPSHARQVIDNTFILYLNENYGEREAQDTIEAILKVEKAYKK